MLGSCWLRTKALAVVVVRLLALLPLDDTSVEEDEAGALARDKAGDEDDLNFGGMMMIHK
jgi:hypothetical protein